MPSGNVYASGGRTKHRRSWSRGVWASFQIWVGPGVDSGPRPHIPTLGLAKGDRGPARSAATQRHLLKLSNLLLSSESPPAVRGCVRAPAPARLGCPGPPETAPEPWCSGSNYSREVSPFHTLPPGPGVRSGGASRPCPRRVAESTRGNVLLKIPRVMVTEQEPGPHATSLEPSFAREAHPCL